MHTGLTCCCCCCCSVLSQTLPSVLGPAVPLMGGRAEDFAVTERQLAGMLSGIAYEHLEPPVRAVGGNVADAQTSADLAASMLQRVTQHNEYAQSNPVTGTLNAAAKEMRGQVAKLKDASALQQFAAAAATAHKLAEQEQAAAQHIQQEAERQQASADVLIAAAFPHPTVDKQAAAEAATAAGGAAAKAHRRNIPRQCTVRAAEQQQQKQQQHTVHQERKQQDELSGQQPPPCTWAVHLLNAFILLQLFSAAMGRTLYCGYGQVYNTILLLMGCAGTSTPGHIDPAAALTFAWPMLLAGEQWSEALMSQVLALWLFVSPSREAWRLLIDWLLQRQQTKGQAAGPAAAVAAPASEASVFQQQQTSSERQRVQKAGMERVPGDHPSRTPNEATGSDEQALQRQHPAPVCTAPSKPVSAKQLQEAADQLLRGFELLPDEVHALAQHMGQHAVLVEQRAGQSVSVEPGWKHWVFNQRPCFKLAFELLRPRQAAAVVHMQQQLRGKMFVKQNDYMKVGCRVLLQLQHWAQWLRPQLQATAAGAGVEAAM